MEVPVYRAEDTRLRAYSIERKTKETQVSVALCLDGGEAAVSTGIGFFDHMLTALAFYGGLGLRLEAKGDLEVDGHHTVEDVGIVLGQAMSRALGVSRAALFRELSALQSMGAAAVDGNSIRIQDRPLLEELL